MMRSGGLTHEVSSRRSILVAKHPQAPRSPRLRPWGRRSLNKLWRGPNHDGAAHSPSVLVGRCLAAANVAESSDGFGGEERIHASNDVRLRGFPSMLDKEIFVLALPALFTVLMDPLLGMVDTAIVGHLGAPVLAGVGLGAMFSGIFNWLFSFLSVLTIPKVAGALAKQDEGQAAQHIAQALWLAIPAGLLSTFLSFFAAPHLIGMVNGEAAMAFHSIEYMQWRCISCPFVLIQYVMIGAFRGMKDTRTPLLAAVIANVAHLAMNLLFVYGFGMAAAGAALSTALSQIVSALTLTWLLQKRKLVDWSLFRQGPKSDEIVPFALQGAAVSLRILSVTSVLMASSIILASVGTVAQAAHEITRQLWILLIQVVESFNISNQSLMSSALYAGDLEYASGICRRHIVIACALTTVIGAFVLAFRHPIVALFTSDAPVMGTVMLPLVFMTLMLPIDAITIVMDGSLTAAGQAAWCAQTTIVASLATLAAMLIAANTTTMTLLTTWMTLKVTAILRLPLLLHRSFFSSSSPFKAKLA